MINQRLFLGNSFSRYNMFYRQDTTTIILREILTRYTYTQLSIKLCISNGMQELSVIYDTNPSPRPLVTHDYGYIKIWKGQCCKFYKDDLT